MTLNDSLTNKRNGCKTSTFNHNNSAAQLYTKTITRQSIIDNNEHDNNERVDNKQLVVIRLYVANDIFITTFSDLEI